jgi:apolipoprotein N-acyltransferase
VASWPIRIMASRIKRLTRFWRLPLAIFGGLVSSLAYPREGLWPMIFIAVISLLVSIRGLGFRKSFGVGFVGGFFFYVSQIEWMSLYLGPIPLLALSVLEALIFGLGMAATARVWAWLENGRRNRPIRVALALATIWTAREWVSTNLPYGGFPWSRLAMSQSESFLARWVYFGGQALLTFVIVAVCALAIEWFRSGKSLRGKTTAYSAAFVAVVLAVPLFTALPANPESGSLVIAAVQGNANAGLFANPVRGSILRNHLSATSRIKHLPLGNKIDLVVWPENASDINPLGDAAAGATIKRLVDEDLRVPLVFGTITERGGQLFNSSMIWKPGIGVTDWYDKKRPVPFAEYVPDHDFWYSLAPDLIGLISRGYTFGTRDGIFDLENPETGKTRHLGVLICFEIAIDGISRDLVNSGAQVILSQTNNSDFGRSDETFQQVAIAKLRAIETGRSVVNDSTVGVSAVFAPDGTLLDSLPTFEPGAMVTRVPLRTSLTPAIVIGPTFDLAINFLAIALILFSGKRVRFLRRARREIAA